MTRKSKLPAGTFQSGIGPLLKQLRRARSIAGVVLASRCGLSQATISKIESGRQHPSLDNVISIARALNVESAELAQLLKALNGPAQAEDSAALLDFVPYAPRGEPVVIEQLQKSIEKLERASKEIRIYQPFVFPGLLQESAYIEALFRMSTSATRSELERAIEARLARRAVLKDRDKYICFVLTEQSIRTRIGPKPAMQRQLEHVENLMNKDAIRLGIIPWTAQVLKVIPNQFMIFDRSTVILETVDGSMRVEAAESVARYLECFYISERTAVWGDEASELLRAARNAL